MLVLCGFGVGNYYNSSYACLKRTSGSRKTAYPWGREGILQSSPLGRIPFIETEHGALSKSQVILEYLEDGRPEPPLPPETPFARAKCRERIQHLELNVE